MKRVFNFSNPKNDLRQNPFETKKVVLKPEVAEQSEYNFHLENKGEDKSTEVHQNQLKKKVATSLVDVYDKTAKNKFVGCSRVKIDIDLSEKQQVFTVNQVKAIFQERDKNKEDFNTIQQEHPSSVSPNRAQQPENHSQMMNNFVHSKSPREK